MNDIIKYLVKSLAGSTLSLMKKSILIEKPWALIDNDGEIQKLIFKRDKGLILSKNGAVTEGAWDYFPEAKSLLIDRGRDKILLKEQFIDDNVLILKLDGTNNSFFVLSNENTIPDYNVPKYLNSVKCKEFKIVEKTLLNGKIIQIHNGKKSIYHDGYVGEIVEIRDQEYNLEENIDGRFVLDDKSLVFSVDGGKILSVKPVLLYEMMDGKVVEIEDGTGDNIYNNRNKRITINGLPVPDSRLTDSAEFIYEIKESRISEILTICEYTLKNVGKIKIEQKNHTSISKGDRIVASEPIFPLPDGSYRIKGKWGKYNVKEMIIQ